MTGRRRFVVAGAALAAGASGLAGCAKPILVSAPAAPPRPPAVRVGDRWRYAKVNLYNGEQLADQVMRVTAVEPRVRIEVSGSDDQDQPPEIYAGAWNVVQETVWDLVQVFNAPCPLLPRRLEPGAVEHWRGTYQVPGDGWHHAWSVRVQAHGWERVDVPAGRFEALRVTRLIAFQHQDLRRAESRRRETLWYAPQVNRWVRREIDGSHIIPGLPPMGVKEDRVGWVLVAHAPAGR